MAVSEKLWTPEPPALQIVAYVDHEFIPPTDAKLSHDIADMVDSGFNTVVLPVTETDIANADRQRQLGHIVVALKEADMQVWADPWGVGGTFGGEGISHFVENGELSCHCNPNLMDLYYRWADTAKNAGIDTAFLDEPEMKCDAHSGDERPFLQTITDHNKQLGLENVVVFCADDSKRDQIKEVAGYATVDQFGTDPYFPNAFQRNLIEADRLGYVTDWVDFTLETGMAVGKPAHIWVQNFGIPTTKERMIAEHVAICRQRMASVAIWAYDGCASVPDFAKSGDVAPQRAWQLTKAAMKIPFGGGLQ